MTPDMVFTLSRRGPGGACGEAADLSAIRRADAIIDLLASRRLRQPSVVHDPAILALAALAADVDADIARADGPPRGMERPAGEPAQIPAHSEPAAISEWARTLAAAVLVATAAGAAASTSMAVTGMLLRLARQGGAAPWSVPGQPRWAPRAARSGWGRGRR